MNSSAADLEPGVCGVQIRHGQGVDGIDLRDPPAGVVDNRVAGRRGFDVRRTLLTSPRSGSNGQVAGYPSALPPTSQEFVDQRCRFASAPRMLQRVFGTCGSCRSGATAAVSASRKLCEEPNTEAATTNPFSLRLRVGGPGGAVPPPQLFGLLGVGFRPGVAGLLDVCATSRGRAFTCLRFVSTTLLHAADTVAIASMRRCSPRLLVGNRVWQILKRMLRLTRVPSRSSAYCRDCAHSSSSTKRMAGQGCDLRSGLRISSVTWSRSSPWWSLVFGRGR